MIEPGIYEGISNEEYHRAAGWRDLVGSTSLKAMGRTPAHAKVILEASDDRRPCYDFGIAMDDMLSDAAGFVERVAVMPKMERRSKVGKAIAAAWEQSNAHKAWITQEQLDSCMAISRRVWSSERMREILDGAEYQLSIVFDFFGTPCKCRPDFVNRKLGLAGDWKTTRDADPKNYFGLPRDIRNLKYFVQLGLYAYGIEQILGFRPDPYYIVALESAPPNGIQRYALRENSLNYGILQAKVWAKQLAECRETDTWTCYSDEDAEWELDERDQIRIASESDEDESADQPIEAYI